MTKKRFNYGYIYKITNLLDEKYYIGKTKLSLKQRWKNHIKSVRRNNPSHLHRAIRLYGIENFIITEVEQCITSILDKKEKYWIEAYKSNNILYGYNMTSGGEGGDTLTQHPQYKEICARMSRPGKKKPYVREKAYFRN